MKLIPITPIVNSSYSLVPLNSKRQIASLKKGYIREARIMQESYEVYQNGISLGVRFVLRDYGIRDLYKIGFTLLIETPHHTYEFNSTSTTVTYIDDNQFVINITNLQRIPVKRCYLVINWILYSGILDQYHESSKIKLNKLFERPQKADIEFMNKVDRTRTTSASTTKNFSNKKIYSKNDLLTAWTAFSELADSFFEIQTIIQEITLNHSTLQLECEVCNNSTDLISVPINCYFDKGFYSTVYYVNKYPITDKRLTSGKSALQCVIGVNSEHLDVLFYLFYCTIEQRNYFQYLNDEQKELQCFLETNHPIVKLRNKIDTILQNFPLSEIVRSSNVIQQAQNVISDYYDKIKEAREFAYNQLVNNHNTHGKWVSEYKLFNLIKIVFPDAEYQYTTDWLQNQVLDVFIPSLNCAVEYQGEQHYQTVEYFGGKEKLISQVYMDNAKRQKCQEQGVKLLEWSYSLQINMPNVCAFFQEYVPDHSLDCEAIEKQISKLPIINMYYLLSFDSHNNAKVTIKKKKPQTNKTEIRKYDTTGKFITAYPSVTIAAEYENLSVGGINKAIYGERKTAGGFQWKRYATELPKTDISAIER